MSRVKVGVVPPGYEPGSSGWHFPAGKDWTAPILNGDDFDNLVDKLVQFRADNSLPIGNARFDVETYICTKFPTFCRGGAKAVAPTTPAVIREQKPAGQPRTLLERVTTWAKLRFNHAGNIKFVSDSTAEARASICSRCKANREWREGCPPCVARNDSLLIQVRQNKAVAQSHRLKGCAAAGHDNNTAVWLPEPLLRHRKHYELPDICWMNKLTEGETK